MHTHARMHAHGRTHTHAHAHIRTRNMGSRKATTHVSPPYIKFASYACSQLATLVKPLSKLNISFGFWAIERQKLFIWRNLRIRSKTAASSPSRHSQSCENPQYEDILELQEKIYHIPSPPATKTRKISADYKFTECPAYATPDHQVPCMQKRKTSQVRQTSWMEQWHQ